MSGQQVNETEDEIFFDMLKDEFVFFYALTVSLIDLLKNNSIEDE